MLFEEMGGNPTQLSFATRQTGSLCSHVSESHPLPIEMWTTKKEEREKTGPTMLLECPSPNQVISSIKFVSFGTPRGTCGSFSHGRCNSHKALATVQKVFPGSNLVFFQKFPFLICHFTFIDLGMLIQACMGSTRCSIGVSVKTFGDPCVGITKSLAVEASCT